jgi:cytochrome P450
MLRCGPQCKSILVAKHMQTHYICSIAGSDSTSGALRAIFYFLMKHPEKMSKLIRDIDDAFEDGTLTHPVQYNQAMKVPYLKAVIQESLRLFPPFGVPMPRYAPAAGLQISGYHIPGGSKVSNTRCQCFAISMLISFRLV